MIQALLPVILIGVAILLAAMKTRSKSRYPVRYDLKRAPLSGLDPQENGRLSAITSALEELGFRSVGEYAIEFQHQSDRQLEQFRFYLSADRKTLACYKRIAHFLHSTAGLARSNSEFELMSWSDSGECAITHARSGASGPAVPGISVRAVNLEGHFETLPVQHERHQAEALKSVVPLADDEAAARYAGGWEKVMRSLAEKGKLEIVDGVWYRQSFTMSVVSVVGGLLPWRLERQPPRRVKGILLTGMLVAFVGAWLIPGRGWNVQLAMGSLYAAFIPTFLLLLPQSTLISWISATAPANLLMAAMGTQAESPWTYPFFACWIVTVIMERIRYRNALVRSGSERPPGIWRTRHWLIALGIVLLSAAAAGALRFALPLPRDVAWVERWALPLVILLLGSLLVMVITIPLYLFPTIRGRTWFPWVLVATLSASIIILGAYLGFVQMEAERRHKEARAKKIVQAVQAYTSDTGSYPKSLEEMVPDWLDSDPFDAHFEYVLIQRRNGTSQPALWYWAGWKQVFLDSEQFK